MWKITYSAMPYNSSDDFGAILKKKKWKYIMDVLELVDLYQEWKDLHASAKLSSIKYDKYFFFSFGLGEIKLMNIDVCLEFQ